MNQAEAQASATKADKTMTFVQFREEAIRTIDLDSVHIEFVKLPKGQEMVIVDLPASIGPLNNPIGHTYTRASAVVGAMEAYDIYRTLNTK